MTTVLLAILTGAQIPTYTFMFLCLDFKNRREELIPYSSTYSKCSMSSDWISLKELFVLGLL